MKSLLEHAQSSAKKYSKKYDKWDSVMPETIEQLQGIYADGYCAGVQEAIEKLKYMPEYYDARDYLEFKMGIDIY